MTELDMGAVVVSPVGCWFTPTFAARMVELRMVDSEDVTNIPTENGGEGDELIDCELPFTGLDF